MQTCLRRTFVSQIYVNGSSRLSKRLGLQYSMYRKNLARMAYLYLKYTNIKFRFLKI
nr:MAG TPA: hypothetical protein [Caudoviricetes sp.]